MLMRLVLVVIVFGVVAFAVGTMTAPEVGEGNPRIKILAAASIAKEHRASLEQACSLGTLRPDITLTELGLKSPGSYAANYRSRVQVEVKSKAEAFVTVYLKAIGGDIPDASSVRYAGNCQSKSMQWQRSTSPSGLLAADSGAAW